jgi:UrcA family protein
MIKRTLTAIIGTALIAAPAYAQIEDTMSVEVRIDDLDLGSADGVARLDRRIRYAAGQICGEEPRVTDLRVGYQRCRSQVVGDANVKLAALKDRSATIQLARRTR